MHASHFPWQSAITSELLDDVRQLWFRHLAHEKDFMAPGKANVMRWFKRDDGLDEICIVKFRSVLEKIISLDLKALDILRNLNPRSPFDWLSLVLLFDQITRNSYRDADSHVVFNYYDPIAREIALHAIQIGIPEDPALRHQFALRMWFYLPLTHSEDLELHQIAALEYEKMKGDAEKLQLPAEVRGFCSFLLGGEARHRDVIRQFGRYPHRNEPLGRKSTTQEDEYLNNGGDTFDGSTITL